jgi:hypothetical protein
MPASNDEDGSPIPMATAGTSSFFGPGAILPMDQQRENLARLVAQEEREAAEKAAAEKAAATTTAAAAAAATAVPPSATPAGAHAAVSADATTSDALAPVVGAAAALAKSPAPKAATKTVALIEEAPPAGPVPILAAAATRVPVAIGGATAATAANGPQFPPLDPCLLSAVAAARGRFVVVPSLTGANDTSNSNNTSTRHVLAVPTHTAEQWLQDLHRCIEQLATATKGTVGSDTVTITPLPGPPTAEPLVFPQPSSAVTGAAPRWQVEFTWQIKR